MMKKIIILFCVFWGMNVVAQKDSLQLGDRYLEDQLYMNVSYNVLTGQPNGVNSSGFSYGVSAGYIKDIPLSKQGNYAFGIGLGYSYDSFNHSLKLVQNNSTISFEVDAQSTSNVFRLHNLELPIQLRWRTSDAVTYSFWRVYAGLVVRYNFYNGFTNTTNGVTSRVTNVANFNNWQTALTLSAGYGTFNFYVSYGISPLFKNATLNGQTIDTKVLKLGLSFYLL
ncbi:OMP_b-brl_2 domain-containing protein [Tenacibaculum sp. 190130A14a]|uniref:OMP_b-brl_2 domain-containing protein n=1 Tax=Tenacibaculum polynesiense TaxID=3137857 RepID=A0ABP1EZW7_9FLAO